MVSDHLSRLENLDEEYDEESSIKAEFPDEYLYSLNLSNTLWYADYANYLAFEILPSNLSYQQKNKLFSDVKHYLWKDPFLFKVCTNGMIRICVLQGEMNSILYHCHDWETRGHFGATRTIAKVLESVFIGLIFLKMPTGMFLSVIDVNM